jgi:inner membrane protein
MASFGHVAVGLLASRLHGGKPERPRRPHCSLGVMVAFTALALLPDADLLLVALGATDHGPAGHRGASHSLAMAAVAGLLCALAARWRRWPVLRTALIGAFAVGSHAVLDVLGEGGRGLPLLWPFSDVRFHSPWRIFPDAPRGMELLTRLGLIELGLELVLFLPITLYALWPRLRTAWAARRGARVPPQLTVLDGGGFAPPRSLEPPTPAPEVRPLEVMSVSVDGPPRPSNDTAGDPPQLSSA